MSSIRDDVRITSSLSDIARFVERALRPATAASFFSSLLLLLLGVEGLVEVLQQARRAPLTSPPVGEDGLLAALLSCSTSFGL